MKLNFSKLSAGDIIAHPYSFRPLLVIYNQLDYDLDGEESTLHILELASIELSDDGREWISADHTDWHLTLQELKKYNVICYTDPTSIRNLTSFAIKY